MAASWCRSGLRPGPVVARSLVQRVCTARTATSIPDHDREPRRNLCSCGTLCLVWRSTRLGAGDSWAEALGELGQRNQSKEPLQRCFGRALRGDRRSQAARHHANTPSASSSPAKIPDDARISRPRTMRAPAAGARRTRCPSPDRRAARAAYGVGAPGPGRADGRMSGNHALLATHGARLRRQARSCCERQRDRPRVPDSSRRIEGRGEAARRPISQSRYHWRSSYSQPGFRTAQEAAFSGFRWRACAVAEELRPGAAARGRCWCRARGRDAARREFAELPTPQVPPCGVSMVVAVGRIAGARMEAQGRSVGVGDSANALSHTAFPGDSTGKPLRSDMAAAASRVHLGVVAQRCDAQLRGIPRGHQLRQREVVGIETSAWQGCACRRGVAVAVGAPAWCHGPRQRGGHEGAVEAAGDGGDEVRGASSQFGYDGVEGAQVALDQPGCVVEAGSWQCLCPEPFGDRR